MKKTLSNRIHGLTIPMIWLLYLPALFSQQTGSKEEQLIAALQLLSRPNLVWKPHALRLLIQESTSTLNEMNEAIEAANRIQNWLDQPIHESNMTTNTEDELLRDNIRVDSSHRFDLVVEVSGQLTASDLMQLTHLVDSQRDKLKSESGIRFPFSIDYGKLNVTGKTHEIPRTSINVKMNLPEGDNSLDLLPLIPEGITRLKITLQHTPTIHDISQGSKNGAPPQTFGGDY